LKNASVLCKVNYGIDESSPDFNEGGSHTKHSTFGKNVISSD